MSINNGKIQSISWWRSIACLMVFGVHLGQRLYLDGSPRLITDFGAYGVQLFLIISGFLIAKSFYDYGKDKLYFFYAKKAIALLPLYYVVVFYYFIMHTIVFKDVPLDPTGFGWIRYILPINYILPRTGLYFWDNLGITWTIPLFFWGYVLIPLLLKIVKSMRASILLFCCAVLLMLASEKGYLGGWFAFLEYFPSLVLGVVFFFALREEKTSALLLGISVYATLLWALKTEEKLMCSCWFVVWLIATKDMSIKSKVLNKLLAVGDKYSYTMYLAHGIIFIHILDRHELGWVIELLIAVVATAILTFLIKTLIETPVQKLLRRWLKKIENRKKAVLDTPPFVN